MNEKRSFYRLKKKLDMKFTLLNAPSIDESVESWIGQTQLLDISQGGILFTYDRSIPISSFLEIEISFPDRDLPIYLTGKVVRVEEIEHDKEYNIGFSFSNIFEPDKELLISHLEEISDN
ncbi:MAG: PilZ domain-containing protein [Spirochaetota bacterium]|nr:PilZ domain-containing protein [Spirochaetota bacterium]